MTVAELIEKLKTLERQHKTVVIDSYPDVNYDEVKNVGELPDGRYLID